MKEKTLTVLEYDKIIGRLLDCAVSQMGKDRIRELKPECGMSSVTRLMEETRAAHGFIQREGRNPMEVFYDIRDSLKRARVQSTLTLAELLKVAVCLKACHKVKRRLSGDESILGSSALSISTFDSLYKAISGSILGEDEVADSASPKLNDIRRSMRACNQKVKDKLNGYIHSSSFQKYLQEPIITIRNNRYVIPVKQECRANVPGLLHDSSASGATLFIEPMAVVEINNDLKQLEAAEREEIERILYELTVQVADASESLEANLIILAELDVIFARAALALDMKATEPKLNDEGMIDIRQGRHPLIAADSVVPLDIRLGEGYHCMIITGPNTGGKTVTLKLAGLFTLMAQTGLFIPVGEGSRIAVFEDIRADIGDEQSIEQSLSTFSSHMLNIVGILSDLKPDSLVLLDELGAGTDPAEGAALATAILDELRAFGVRVLATTHYSELKTYAMVTDGLMNASMEFDVATLAPTYRLLMGIPGKSNAFEISRKLGLPDNIIERSKTYLSTETVSFEDIISRAQKSSQAADEERREAEKERDMAQQLRQSAEDEKRVLAEKREAILEKAREEAMRIIQDARDEAESVISGLKELGRQGQSERTKGIEKSRKALKDAQKTLETDDTLEWNDPPEKLETGNLVRIHGMDTTATVLSRPDDKGDVLLQAGIMKMTMNINRLRLVNEEKVQRERYNKVSVQARAVPLELDMRGMTVDEALIELDKYLDDASICGANTVSIIHGKGTGALRTGVHEHLRKHPHVKSFRLGKYGEGESGVSIVELK